MCHNRQSDKPTLPRRRRHPARSIALGERRTGIQSGNRTSGMANRRRDGPPADLQRPDWMKKLPMSHPMPLPSGSLSHRQQAAALGSIPLAVVTVSDTRTPETDENGQYLRAQIQATLVTIWQPARIAPVDERRRKSSAVLDEFCAGEVRLIFNGGTGVARRDTTFDEPAANWRKPCPASANSSAS